MVERLKIVIIEDEKPLRRFLKAGFTDEAAEIFEAETGADGLKLIARENPDIVLLDLGLPDLDGLEVLAQVREWSTVPIIVLSARGQEKDKILALDGGADDYLTKPFSVNELLARIRVALRHAARDRAPAEPVFDSSGLRIDFQGRQVFVDGVEVRLTALEYRLLAFLAKHAGMVLTHKQLLSEVWGPAYEDASHALRVHMAAIRQKIEADPASPKFIRTETGVGYRLVA